MRDSYQAEKSAVPHAKHYQNHQNEPTAFAAGIYQNMKHRLPCGADLFEILDGEQQCDEQKKAKGGRCCDGAQQCQRRVSYSLSSFFA